MTSPLPDLGGYLHKKSRGGKWQRRWFEATDQFLCYYMSPQSAELLACIDLHQTGSVGMTVEDGGGEESGEAGCEFRLKLGERFYVVKAESREDARWWVEGLVVRKGPEEELARGEKGGGESGEEEKFEGEEKKGSPERTPKSLAGSPEAAGSPEVAGAKGAVLSATDSAREPQPETASSQASTEPSSLPPPPHDES